MQCNHQNDKKYDNYSNEKRNKNIDSKIDSKFKYFKNGNQYLISIKI